MEAKKNPEKNLENKKTIFFQTGLILSLIAVFTAFDWKQYERLEINLPSGKVFYADTVIIPVTLPARPEPPPPAPASDIKIVDDKVEVPDDFIVDVSAGMLTPVADYVPAVVPAKPEKEDENKIFIGTEQMPEFPGGERAFFEYLARETQYPEVARRLDIQGTVYVSFVVEADGSISNISVQKGVTEACDREAVRVISSMPHWKPGMQSGKPVRVAFSARIAFRLK